MKAIEFGAEGIGLFRIEHMFYGKDSEALFPSSQNDSRNYSRRESQCSQRT